MLHALRETGGAGEAVEGDIRVFPQKRIRQEKLYGECIRLALVNCGGEKGMRPEVGEGDSRMQDGVT